jgi:hypothetical protein
MGKQSGLKWTGVKLQAVVVKMMTIWTPLTAKFLSGPVCESSDLYK